MDQSFLNKIRVDDWAFENKYEEIFRLKLTSKHAMVVGKWEFNGEWGVDLRRWSYNSDRLLGEGITLNADSWQELYDAIINMHQKYYFSNYGDVSDEGYVTEIIIDECYKLKTGIFIGNEPFFCINMLNNDKQIFKGKHTIIGIMIRFDTISDFLIQCKQKVALVNNESPVADVNKGIDKKSGKSYF